MTERSKVSRHRARASSRAPHVTATWALLILVGAGACSAQGPGAHAPTAEVPPGTPPSEIAESWRREPPPSPTTNAPPRLPEFKVEALGSGLVVVTRHVEGLPIVSIAVVSRGGSAADPPALGGVTRLMYGLLRSHPGRRDYAEFTRAVSKARARVEIAVGRDYGMVGLSGLTQDVDTTMGLLADLALRPTFDEGSLKAVREPMSAYVKTVADPETLAEELLASLLHGPDHPYAHPSYGTADSLRRVDLAAVRAQYGRLFRPQSSALIVVGDLERAAAMALARKHFGAWRSGGQGGDPPSRASRPAHVVTASPRGSRGGSQPGAPGGSKEGSQKGSGEGSQRGRDEGSRSDRAPRRIWLLHRDNLSQSLVCLGKAFPRVPSREEAALFVLNSRYSGSFDSRLQMNLRERQGITYGSSSVVRHLERASEFFACTQIERSFTAEGLRTMIEELEGLSRKPPSAEEVEAAARSDRFRILYGYQTTRASLYLGVDEFLERAAGHEASDSRRLLDGLDEVREANVREVVGRYLSPDDMKLLVVGNARVVRRSLEELGLGEVVTLDR